MTTREEDSFNPTSDGSSQRRTHGTVFVVSRGVSTRVLQKTLDAPKNTQKLKTLNIFFLRVQKPHLLFSRRSALFFSIAKEHITKDVSQR